jgi:hypothetical protein
MSFPCSSTLDAIWARDGKAKMSQAPATAIATAMQFFFIVLEGPNNPLRALGKAERHTSESAAEQKSNIRAQRQLHLGMEASPV